MCLSPMKGTWAGSPLAWTQDLPLCAQGQNSAALVSGLVVELLHSDSPGAGAGAAENRE